MKKVLIIMMIFSAICCSNHGKGTEANPITVYMMPAEENKELLSNSLRLTEFLRKKTGYYFMPVIPLSYSDVILSFGAGKADVAVMASTAYVIANEKYGVHPVLKFLRNERSAYRGQFAVLANGKIREMAQINGKTLAFTSRLSTSGFLYPNLTIHNSGIRPQKEVFSGTHIKAIEMLLSHEVDVACTFEGVQLQLAKKYPDISKTIRIIGYTDYIPNDVICFKKNTGSDIESAVTSAILDYIKTEKGKKVLNELFGIDGFTIPLDEDYDLVRDAIEETGIDVDDFLEQSPE